MSDSRVFIGLGSNLGDRVAFLKAGVTALRATPGIEVTRTSSVYETEPVGPAQPLFLNAVAELRTDIGARELLALLKEIETQVGRMPGKHWGPREIDLDILLYGSGVIDEPDLVVPHPEMTWRAFVLVPLLEIAPEISIPGAGEARLHDMTLGRAGVRLAFPPHLL